MKIKNASGVLVAIVLAQFFCTSLWFAGNAVSKELLLLFENTNNALGHLTAAVQFGFILGTLTYAIFAIPDRFSPSKVFMLSAFLGALSTLAMLVPMETFSGILTSRFLTGFFLAGIYPVGMKIAADYFDKSLGKALGFLVGALVLGTAFPHFIRAFSINFSWKIVIIASASLCIVGGLTIGLFVKDGPFRKKGAKFHFAGLKALFANRRFRNSAFGYFGHMWELYAFWAFVPVMIQLYSHQETILDSSNSLLSFYIIGIGSLSCFFAGWISKKITIKKTALTALLISGCCCLLSPFLFSSTEIIFFVFLLVWGASVIADSPMFSAMVATNAPAAIKGSALTIVNCIGFSMTIISIEIIGFLNEVAPSSPYIFLVLLPGPVFGLWALLKKPKA
ncbi:MFS transporter [Ascidiimonas sp. W6]|uniref:MFS transporter n=1 Tax=Ascidiimonas meishanensis TaxID=3128903 RepID=UPI0030EDA94C